jgi:hypothetical protein
MDRKSIKVIYDGDINEDLDRKIKEAMKTIGAKWVARGYSFQKNKRDIMFYWEEK